MTTVGEIARAIARWAPVETAEGYDNVGLQVGDPAAAVRKVVVALDLTPAVIDEAGAIGADLIVTHHPLLFRPLKRLSPDGLVPALAWRLVRTGIAHIAAHTNADAAQDGVSFVLGQTLGLQDIRTLQPATDQLLKLATFVPIDHASAVRTALAGAGAGHIGAYEACAFETPGTGYFKPLDTAKPYIGSAGGDIESVPEIRLEVELPTWRLDAVLAALKEAHPYEEVAYDVYSLKNRSRDIGMGAIGGLTSPLSLSAFLSRVAERLDARAIRYAGRENREIRTVAVCGGAGRGLLGAALRSGADAFVTSDLGYHTFFDILDAAGEPKLALIDAGHYETERPAEQLLIDKLTSFFPDLPCVRTAVRTGPVNSFVLHTKE